MLAFDYLRPKSLDQAAEAMRAEPGASYIAAGMSLLPLLKERLAAPSALIDLSGIGGLSAIRRRGNTIEIGALATHAMVAASAEVAATIPALARLAADIGDPQVRNRGTVGGALAVNDPSGDWPVAALALAAEIVTDRRTIAADAFFTGLMSTALDPDEIVTALRITAPAAAGYAKFNRGPSRYALAGVFVARTGSGVRVAVTGAAACAFRADAIEQRLTRAFSPASLEGIAIDPEALNSDLHASAEYRSHLVTVMARRAVAAAL